MPRVLIVGAGFAGAVYARILADAGVEVDIIDRRPHIAGNAFDHIDENGLRVHAYGPHLFHTSNKKVVDWVMQYGVWEAYEHRVEALLADGRCVPLPINRNTINAVFGESFETQEQIEAFLARIAIPCAEPRNAAEYLYSRLGRELTDLFFRPYTKKMWTFDLEDMDASVVQRIPIRYDLEDRYFPNDQYQVLPRDGYTAFFENLLDHPNIRIQLSTEFSRDLEKSYAHVFNSMPIDEYFGFELGELPYRSIRFHHHAVSGGRQGLCPTLNYTDDRKFTRETSWHLLPHHIARDSGVRTVTVEEPCDYRDNHNERFYPVKTADNRFGALYQAYQAKGDALARMSFIGRCGTYQYLDMHQVINQSLMGVRAWLAANPGNI